MNYIPTTAEQLKHMLQTIGVQSIEDLFADIPAEVRFQGKLDLPEGLHEQDLLKTMRQLAQKNRHVDDLICFVGGGAYDHFIPAALKTVISRSEFYTAYTPYQAEITQGVLQTIFEFQSLICALTGMDAANASMYEGASSLAEGAIMACAHTGRGRVLIGETCHPEYRLVVETYLRHQNIQVDVVAADQGVTNADALQEMLGDDVAALLVQHPNFYGYLEPVHRLGELVHEVGGLYVVSVDPISLGILAPPADYGADIVVGEGQSLGNNLSFGGPYLGFLAAKQSLLRRIPGRIVGMTTDAQGRRGFVLTLQTREQHIRREKATSNICTNQALNALAATAYLALVGRQGLREVAHLSFQKAHYMARSLALAGIKPLWDRPYFKEFPIVLDGSPHELQKVLLEKGFIAGPRFDQLGLEPDQALLVCATETRTKEEIDAFVQEVVAWNNSR